MKNAAFEEGPALLVTKTELFAALSQDNEKNSGNDRNLNLLPSFL